MGTWPGSSPTIIGGYLAAAILLTWPLALHLDGYLLIGAYGDMRHSDAEINLKTMQDAREMFYANHTLLYLNRKYGHTEYSLVLHYLYIILSPFAGDPLAAYNLYFIASVFLSGAFMHLLVSELTGKRTAAFFGGLLYMSSQYALEEYAWFHPTTMAIQWIPLIFLLVEKTLRNRGKKYPLLLGAALSIQAYSSAQYTVYLTFIIPAYLALRAALCGGDFIRSKPAWSRMSLSAAAALALSGYYGLKRIQMPNTLRTLQENNIWYWVMSSPKALIDRTQAIYLGANQAALALLGIILAVRHRRKEEYGRCLPYAALLILAAWMMMGPYSPYSPYYWLYCMWPLIGYFRVPERMFPFALMCVGILSALVIAHAENLGKGGKKTLILAAAIVASTILLQMAGSPYHTGHRIFLP
jgi:hypothetical protein